MTTTAGIDVGALWTKAAVWDGQAVLASHVAPTGGDTAAAAEAALEAALAGCGLQRGALSAVVATGAGKEEVAFADRTATEVMSAAEGIRVVRPGGSGVIDLGGESTRVLKLDPDGQVAEFALNDKCAAGTGVFLDAMAKVMGVAIEDMGRLSGQAAGDVAITSMCVAFAESEVVSQVHRQTPKADIIKGIHKSIATRVYGMVRRMELGAGAIAIGGLARNSGIVACLEALMEVDLVVPDNPQEVSAIGAAVLAAGQGGGA